MPLVKQKKDYLIIWLPPPICSLKDMATYTTSLKRKRNEDTLSE